MRIPMALVAIAACIGCAGAEDAVGVASVPTAKPDVHGDLILSRDLTLTLWYPATAGGTADLVGDNGVFVGAGAMRDAPVAAGTFPTILISHCGSRSAPNLSGWIAKRLAARGYLAVDVRGPRLGPKDAVHGPSEVWQRPADLSAALDALERDGTWSGHLDADRTAALGFFMGGTAALFLAGGQLEAGAFARACDAGASGADCAWFHANGVDLGNVDTARLTRSNRDPRIKAAIAVDPEYAQAFAAKSLGQIAIPVMVVHLGATDTSAQSGLPAVEGEYVAMPQATQFDAFSLCKPAGAAILLEDGGDEAICAGASADRRSVHEELETVIVDFLQRHLPATR